MQPYDNELAQTNFNSNKQTSKESNDLDSKLFPNYNKNNSFNNSSSNQSDRYQEKSAYDEHYFEWKKKYEDGKADMNLASLEKIDTRGVPNNLFEMKHKALENSYAKNDYNRNDNRFASVSSDPNFKETMNYKGEEPGMIGTFGGLVGDAFVRTKEVLSGVKGKYTEYEVTDKIKTTGEATLGVLKYTGSAIHGIATSDTTKHIIGKTTENIGYLFNRFFGKGEDTSNTNTNSVSSNSNAFIDNDDYYNKKPNYNRYSPPRNSGNADELSGNVLFKKDDSRYSSKSYMS